MGDAGSESPRGPGPDQEGLAGVRLFTLQECEVHWVGTFLHTHPPPRGLPLHAPRLQPRGLGGALCPGPPPVSHTRPAARRAGSARPARLPWLFAVPGRLLS